MEPIQDGMKVEERVRRTRKLKVYGWTGFRSAAGRRPQTREIMAASSAAEVRRVTGHTRSEWERSGCETGNAREVEAAMAQPGAILWKPLDEAMRDRSGGWTMAASRG